MIQFAPWKIALTLGICLLGLIVALPNVLPASVIGLMKQAVILPTQTINLGLDLRGGSYLLLEVNEGPVFVERLRGKIGNIRNDLRKARIQYQGLAAKGDTLSVTIPKPEDRVKAREILDKQATSTTNLMTGFGQKDLDIVEADGVFSLTYTPQAIQQIRQQIIEQSIEIVRRRVDGGGVKEASIQRQGANRILVQVPGLEDPQQLIDLVGKTAKMSFHMVDDSVTPADIAAERLPPGTKLLYERARNPGEQRRPIVIQEEEVITGDMLSKASGGYDQQTGQPIVNFTFDIEGSRRFADVTTRFIGSRFAVVLDDDVITAPVIKGSILGGQGYIEGGFTTKTANDLAIMLNAGALPAEISVQDRRTVSAELGADSVRYGQFASMAGVIIVLVFMFLVYDLFGFFAGLAMIVNAILMVAVFTMFQITMTLPGVAGFVLSMGMAVDANVLIYERMREEFQNGKGLLASIDSGFERASATITDANLTQVIAGLIMIEMTTGPVRGFGVSLVLGIITSFFSAIYITRLLILFWYNTGKRTKLPL